MRKHRDYAMRSEKGGRPKNEDYVNCATAGNNLIVALSDGLGGEGDGEIASHTAAESLLSCGADGKFPARQAIMEAFDNANRAVLAKQKNRAHMKTTAVYLCQQGKRVIWGHIGDSRLYHVFQNQIADYTLDHSASQMSVFMGSITREQIPQDAGRSRLIKALGVEGAEPDIHEEVRLKPGRHAFLLCSDGLWEYLTDAEIIDIFQRGLNAEDTLSLMLDCKETKSMPDCDNYTAFVLLVEV